MLVRTLTALLLTIFAGGCTTRAPNDLALVSIAAVKYGALLREPHLSRFVQANAALQRWREGHPGPLHDVDRTAFDGGMGQQLLVLEVELSSRTNLADVVPRRNAHAEFCDRLFPAAALTTPEVYWGTWPVSGIWSQPPVAEQVKAVSGRYAYLAYIYAQGDASGLCGAVPCAYNLYEEPEDVCFLLKAGGSFGGIESNTVRIPKAMIAAALRGQPAGVGN